jgi:AraC family transcriptional regulator
MKKTLGIHTAPARQWVGNGFPLHSLFSYGTSALADVLDADRELLVGQDDSAGTRADAARVEHATDFEPSGYRRADSGGTADWSDRLLEVSPSDAVSRRIARWPGMAIEIVQASRRCRIDYRYCSPFPLLVLYERGACRDGFTVIEGLPKSTLQRRSRKLIFVPAGREYHDSHEPHTLSRTIFFYFNPSQLAVGPDPGVWHLSVPPRLFFENGSLTETALKLAALVESGGSDQRRYLEALGLVMTHELVRIDTGRHSTQVSIKGGLAAWRQRKVIAYIEEHLAEPISLEVLAGLVGLSACYLCRAFGQSFGMPPLRYQLSQRIERAKALLANYAASVTDVGITVGFNDASAFCTAFRKVTGLTPSAYRRSLG